jgi:hypothetical protein
VEFGDWRRQELREGRRCCFGLHARKNVLTRRHREPWRRVSEPLGHHVDSDTRLQQQGGMGAAKIMEADAGESGSLHELVEAATQYLWMDRRSVGACEETAVWFGSKRRVLSASEDEP